MSLELEEFKAALPAKMKKTITQEVMDSINQKLDDPELYEIYRENLLGYVGVMKEGRFKLSGYIDAVKYVTHKMMGKTNIEAFSIVFPEKVKKWTEGGMASKDINSYVTSFNKSKMVTLLMEQTLTPVWIMNQDVLQQAINEQAKLMLYAKSEKVRSDAANSLMTHLKQPDKHKVELDVAVKESGAIKALRESTEALVLQQQAMIASKAANAQDIAHEPITIEDGEVVD